MFIYVEFICTEYTSDWELLKNKAFYLHGITDMWEVKQESEYDINLSVNNVKFNMAKWVTVIAANNIMKENNLKMRDSLDSTMKYIWKL